MIGVLHTIFLVLLGQPIVDQINGVLVAVAADEKVFWLDVPMDELLLMNRFYRSNERVSYLHDAVFGEFSVRPLLALFLQGTCAVMSKAYRVRNRA